MRKNIKKTSVLIIEDDQVSSKVLCGMLREHFLISTSFNMREGVDFIRNGAPDVVLLDLRLPDADRLQSLIALRRHFPFMPIVVVTATDDINMARRAVSCGAQEYLIKGRFAAPDIIRAVHCAIARKKADNLSGDRYAKAREENIRLTKSNRTVRQICTELEKKNKELHMLSFKDELTRLFNRRFLFEFLECEFDRAVRYHLSLSLIMIDIDYFKNVNDLYGHRVGDDVLKAFSMLLRESVRNVDIVGRYGGEEFMVILPHTSEKNAKIYAQRLHASINGQKIKVKNSLVTLSASIGVSDNDHHDVRTVSDLIDCADKAMYQVKRQGRNSVMSWGEYLTSCVRMSQFASSEES